MRIAISGITGHIGNNVASTLLQNGFAIKALARKSKTEIKIDDKIETIHGDLNDLESLDLLSKDVDLFIHIAGKVSIYPYDKDVIYNTNIEGVNNVINACLRNGVKKIIHFSSIHAHHSTGSSFPINENTAYVNSEDSAYDFSKSQGEQLMLKARERGIDVCILNPTAVIGPLDYRPSYSGKMFVDIYNRKLPLIVEGGFDWVDVRDISDAVLTIIQKNIQNEKFILSGHWASIKYIAEQTCLRRNKKYMGYALPIFLARIGVPFIATYAKIANTPPLYTSASITAIEKGSRFVEHQHASNLLAYNPRPLNESIDDTISWLKQYFTL